MNITTIRAITIANKLEAFLSTLDCCVALGGSCLHKGGSDKDIDIIIIPLHTDTRISIETLLINIAYFTGTPLVKRDHSLNKDQKVVWKGKMEGHVVDFFFLQ